MYLIVYNTIYNKDRVKLLLLVTERLNWLQSINKDLSTKKYVQIRV